jgi:hypothetical protein
MDEHERDRLLSFVDDLDGFFERWLERLREPTEDYVLLERAWSELKPRFGEVKGAIRSGDFDDLLDQHGLSGAQLEFKLRGFNRAVEKAERSSRGWRRWLRRVPEVLFPVQPPRWRRWGSRFLGSALRWANTILGSIGKVIAPAGAIKEFKEVFEAWRRGDEGTGGSWFARFLGVSEKDAEDEPRGGRPA